MDRVAGVIDVSLTDNTHEVVISYPALQPDVNGIHKIVIMPRYARHLGNLLIEYAAAAEAKTNREVVKSNFSTGESGSVPLQTKRSDGISGDPESPDQV